MNAPWTKEQARQWANEYPYGGEKEADAFLDGLAKAAEMIEASETIYANDNNSNSSFWYRQGHASDTHQAKLLCVKQIEKGKSDE